MIDIKHNKKLTGEKIDNLKEGAVFMYEGDFYIKTDEEDGYGDPQCVRLKDGYLISPDSQSIVEAAASVTMEVVL